MLQQQTPCKKRLFIQSTLHLHPQSACQLSVSLPMPAKFAIAENKMNIERAYKLLKIFFYVSTGGMIIF